MKLLSNPFPSRARVFRSAAPLRTACGFPATALYTLVCCLVGGVAAVGAAEVESPQRVEFARDIRPILSDNCFFCHGPDPSHREADLRLDVRQGLYEDRGGYAAVVPGELEASELLRRIQADDSAEKMPPPDSGKELTAEQIRKIRRWIEQGAEWQDHWSYRQLRRPALPEVSDREWPVQPIDRFVLSRIERAGLQQAPQADPRTLVRRVHFDLLGLPPTPSDVEAFISDTSPDAYDRLVDRLLASPHFGERMATHWLDLVRYADTVGYHGDQEHHISPYRDYVIKSFNDNLPFDQFTVEQLAGDLLPNPTLWQRIATGYNRVLQTTHEGGAQDKEYLAKYAADRVRNASEVWLGATMGCAECHDHKYDPYTQKDFYSFAAFFADIEQRGAYPGPDRTPTVRAPEIPGWNLQQYAQLSSLDRSIEDLQQQLADGAPTELADHIAQLEQKKAAIEEQFALTMVTVSVEPLVTRVLPRGDWLDESGPVVEPAVPHFLRSLEVDGRATRLDLARWLVAPDNPLTARVFVNRLWKLFYGRGLSPSLDDFGAQGQSPTHPELLDWLASEFIDSGWDVKHLVRLMVTSQTYRQSSQVDASTGVRDAENRYFARQSRQRLDAEMIRDNALAVSGLLVPKLGGRSVKPYQPDGYYQHLNFPKREYEEDTDANQWRRGLYMHWQRIFLHPMLKAFDAPSREECTAQRAVSNTPLAALVLLNDPSFVEAARAFAAKILRESSGSDEQRIAWAWQRALSRPPTPNESHVVAELLAAERTSYAQNNEAATQLTSVGLAPKPDQLDPQELAAWTAVARAILNLNETITRN